MASNWTADDHKQGTTPTTNSERVRLAMGAIKCDISADQRPVRVASTSDLEMWLRASELGDCPQYPLTRGARLMIAKLRDAIALAKKYATAAELSALVDLGVP